jgi:G3E family GTPase
MSNSAISVYILTGFLGSGKTTLLNHLLAQKIGERNVVIENEFGKISIDSMIVEVKKESIFELTNGCICCSLDQELEEILLQLMQMDPRPDNLFIEASGVADPGSLVSLFEDSSLQKIFALKQVCCVIDAEQVADQIEEIPEIIRQIISSDLLLVNKKSSVSVSYLKQLEEELKALNPLAKIVFIDFGKLDFSSLEGSRSLWTFPKPSKEMDGVIRHPFKSFLMEFEKGFDRDLLINQMTVLFFLYYHQVYRVKGVVYLSSSDSPHLLQSNGRQVSLTSFEPPKNMRISEKSQVVVIGKGVTRPLLERIFKRPFA